MKVKNTRAFINSAILALLAMFVWSTFGYSISGAASQTQRSNPTVDEILDRYVVALGGRTRIEAIKTMVSKAEFESQLGVARLVVYVEAPNKFLTTIDWPEGAQTRNGCDGLTAWNENAAGEVHVETGLRLKALLRANAFPFAIRMRSLFKEFAFSGVEHLETGDAYVVDAMTDDGLQSEYYFSIETGLLMRYVDETYEEGTSTSWMKRIIKSYRDIGGIKVPDTIYEESPRGHAMFHLKESHLNVPIDESIFRKPDSRH